MSNLLGQNLRLFIGEKCIAAATSCSLHIAAQTESSRTKDTTGEWDELTTTGKTWDCSAEALVVIDAADTSGMQAFDYPSLIGTKVTVKLCQTNGEKNRTKVSSGKELSGEAIVTDFTMNAPDNAKSTYSIQLQGTGALQ